MAVLYCRALSDAERVKFSLNRVRKAEICRDVQFKPFLPDSMMIGELPSPSPHLGLVCAVDW